MENDPMFKIWKKINYPWIYRHDRQLYQKHKQIDPLRLLARCALAFGVGQFIGKFLKKRQVVTATLFTLPIIAKYLYDEKVLSNQLTRYYDVSINKSVKVIQNTSGAKNIGSSDSKSSDSNEIKNKIQTLVPVNRITKRNLPHLQEKIYNANDLISQLSPSYFN